MAQITATPARIAAMYELLRALPPFNRWKLPSAAGVKFGATRAKDTYGIQQRVLGRHHMWVARRISLPKFIETVAHEMCHIHEDSLVVQYSNGKYRHTKEFKRLAEQVCKKLGFNPETF